ncbi:MAG TPA: hypothetical protein VFL51_12060, partial [Pseudolabrys sp.]|nr:hypothetical protein [Pseudolabrys sp.]
RVLELPATGWLRRYRVRAHGRVTQTALDGLKRGVTIDGMRYGPIEATLDREQGSNVWLTFAIREGKNREVRNVLHHLGLQVNRLIRVSFGPFELGDLADGAVEEVETALLRKVLDPHLARLANADFTSPLESEGAKHRRHSGAGRRPEPGIQQHRRSKGLDSGSPLRGVRNDRQKLKSRAPQDDGSRPNRIEKKNFKRRDRAHGPRPKYPRPK